MSAATPADAVHTGAMAQFPSCPSIDKSYNPIYLSCREPVRWSAEELLRPCLPPVELQAVPDDFPSLLRPLLGVWHARDYVLYRGRPNVWELIVQPDYTLHYRAMRWHMLSLGGDASQSASLQPRVCSKAIQVAPVVWRAPNDSEADSSLHTTDNIAKWLKSMGFRKLR